MYGGKKSVGHTVREWFAVKILLRAWVFVISVSSFQEGSLSQNDSERQFIKEL
jgi:hypothetical protein